MVSAYHAGWLGFPLEPVNWFLQVAEDAAVQEECGI